jgi:hypothetical protein
MSGYESHQYDVIVIGPAGRAAPQPPWRSNSAGSEW